jgi:hypothetical protein
MSRNIIYVLMYHRHKFLGLDNTWRQIQTFVSEYSRRKPVSVGYYCGSLCVVTVGNTEYAGLGSSIIVEL